MKRRLPVLTVSLLLFPLPTFAQRPDSDPVTLARDGWAAIEERRFADALDAFTKAATLVRREPTLWLGAGLSAYMLGDTDAAETSLERALTLDPRLRDASLILGELQYRAGRTADAIATYEVALKYAPGEKAFADRLAQWQKDSRVSDRFYESRGAHFRVLFEGPADEALARRAVEMLEAAYWRVGTALTTFPSQPITVVLYTLEQFRDITQAPEWSAGMYDGRIRVPVRGGLDHPAVLDRILTHEFVHAVVAVLGGRNVPTWLNEGLATMFQPGGVDEAQETLERTSFRLPLVDLHGGFRRYSGEAVRVAYAQSAAAVKRMIDLRGAPAVVALLQDLAGGASFAPAFHQRLAMRYEDFQAMITHD